MRPLRILVDTNVWLDQFLPARPHERESRMFIDHAVERGASLAYAAGSLKDVFYIIGNECKRLARGNDGELAEADALYAQEYAWGCIEAIQNMASPVGMDLVDIRKASIWRRSNSDFEDNLIRAAADRLEADFVVTWDKGMLSKCFVPTVTPAAALSELDSWAKL